MSFSNRLGKIILAAAAVMAVSVVSAQAQVVVGPAGGSFGDQVGNPWTTSVYTQTATGGTAPFTFAISSGAAPAGVQLQSNGTYIGAPAITGTFTYTVRATSATGTTGTVTYTITVFPQAVIAQTALATLTAGTASTATTFTASGGSAPFTWALAGGALPTGLTLGGVNNNVVSGTPTTAQNYSFTIGATDSNGILVTQVVSGAVNPAAAPVPTMPTWILLALTAGLLAMGARSLKTSRVTGR